MDLKNFLNEVMEIIKGILKKIPEIVFFLPSKVISTVKSLFHKKQAPLKTKDKRSVSSHGGVLRSFVTKIRSLFDSRLKSGKISGFLVSLENRFLHRFPEKKRRPLLLGLAGIAMLFFVLLISTLLTFTGRPERAALPESTAVLDIPAGEFFIPSEPDFLPEFLLERPPRGFWTLDDIRPYWRIPEHTELWREQITSAVDRLMEGVP
jgi:hypothetical protein